MFKTPYYILETRSRTTHAMIADVSAGLSAGLGWRRVSWAGRQGATLLPSRGAGWCRRAGPAATPGAGHRRLASAAAPRLKTYTLVATGHGAECVATTSSGFQLRSAQRPGPAASLPRGARTAP